jgi:excisionase family DNA binding protein
MESVLERPTLHDQQLASESLRDFTRSTMAIRKKSGVAKIKLQDSDKFISLPLKALELLQYILTNMAAGKAISLIPSDSEVTTQQAADMLNVSRPHVVKLLESGVIPFRKVGSHRRILLEDLMKYEAELKKQRNEGLQQLAQQAQELNLGYE